MVSMYVELIISLACAVAGAFLILNGPVFVVSHIVVFKKGPSVPDWTLRTITWLNRVTGAWALILSIALMIQLFI